MKLPYAVALCAISHAALAADQADTLLYHHSAFGPEGHATVESVTALGSREARPMGEQGLEQGARLTYQATDRVGVEAWGGALFREGSLSRGSASVEAHLGLVDPARARPVGLTLGLGYLYDYRGDHVPRVRLTLQRQQGPVSLVAATLLERPIEEESEEGERDEVDVIVSLAASAPVGARARVGVEAIGEDLEGFWEEEEAEGGAKLVVGPTVWGALPGGFHLKANVAGILPASQNFPTTTNSQGEVVPNDPGVLGRLMIGYTF